MDKLPFTHVIRDPGSADGIPAVGTSTPVPRRDKPLPGTKDLNFPANEHLFGIESGHPEPKAPPGRTATVFGILALVCSVALIGLFWTASWPSSWGGSLPLCSMSFAKGAAFLLLGLTSVFAIMSHIVSDGRCRIGHIALMVLVAGIILSAGALAFLERAK